MNTNLQHNTASGTENDHFQNMAFALEPGIISEALTDLHPGSEHLFCCPECNGQMQMMQIVNGEISFQYKCMKCELVFPVNRNYIDFMGKRQLEYHSSWDKFLRTQYAKIYTPATNLMFLVCGGVAQAKKEVLDQLEIKNDYKILETGIGAAENFRLLHKRAENLSFFGLDIQQQMLKHSVKNLLKWRIPAQLFQADAHYLPFMDHSFDVVFHLGSINLFPDKERAISEMIRVAKPGTKIVIADESEKAGRYFNMLTGIKEKVVPPVHLIPKPMQEVKLMDIWKGNGYLISFRKPLN
ncbi:methyltransferase domain-containing protein [Saccharicrinis sp. FJH54]|uniref:methyltransferase domain-containing protein n=1 Tax=Saccharicrinis sp. FJH54 TaxID=3344665 RepID=UPI0035D4F4EE